MKYTTNLFFLFICLFLNACSDDDNSKKNDDRPETLGWIEDKMREKYYWNSEIPSKPSYSADEEAFFKSLLSKNDGKTRNGTHYYYSYIEKASSSTRGGMKENYTYGFEFTTVSGFKDQNGTTFTGALVLYVYNDTPADKAELKRGDWIVKIDGQYITSNETVKTLYGDAAKEFMVYQWVNNKFMDGKTVSIGAAEAITNYSPIYHQDIITASNGKQVGYMVYDRFQSGPDNKDSEYDDELRQASHFFSGVDEFVLDLRYNNGGLLSSTRLFCAILGPSDILSKSSIGHMEYADGTKSQFSANKALLGSGKNLNLPKLYVLTSSTTASASEAVINLLDPYMDVIVIGEKTEGKNVGSQEFVSEDKLWEMHPITSMIFNSIPKSDYTNGWPPDHILDDALYHDAEGYVDPIEGILDLGDEEERLLKAALHHIVNGSFPAAIDRTRTTKSTGHKLGINSLDRKAAPIFID